ncbi:hypothetical protein ASG56_06595 [Rhodococcus sp. Leaf7]|nr:hypothetical protein ASG56_06595 [Rhodococcus sp. Leaf7]KQU42718.1 hypothetical protein ASG64_06595 [Rhodococcus sp. Leaf247]
MSWDKAGDESDVGDHSDQLHQCLRHHDHGSKRQCWWQRERQRQYDQRNRVAPEKVEARASGTSWRVTLAVAHPTTAMMTRNATKIGTAKIGTAAISWEPSERTASICDATTTARVAIMTGTIAAAMTSMICVPSRRRVRICLRPR